MGAAKCLRVATYNCLHGLDLGTGAVDLPALAEAIRGLGADVVAIQEVDRGQPRSGRTDQAAWLAERLGWHTAFAPALIGDPGRSWTPPASADHAAPAYGIALLSRRRLHAPAWRRLPGGGPGQRRPTASPGNPGWDREPRVALRAGIEGTGVVVATTHLSYLPWRGSRQLRAAARWAAEGGDPTVLLGDLNLPVWPVRLALPGWRHLGGTPTYPAHRPRMQTDQALVRGHIEATGTTVSPPATSDHLPLVVDLRIG